MSGAYDPERNVSNPDIVLVRKSFGLGNLIIGRPLESESLDTCADADETPVPEAEVDTAEIIATPNPVVADEQGVSESRLPSRFTVQRPVIFSSTQAGFFENEEAQSLLLSMHDEARFPLVPHVTIAQQALIRQIMLRRKGMPVNGIASECRQVVDKLPDRKYAHVMGAKTIGERAVALDLDWDSRGKLLSDVRGIAEHYGIPMAKGKKAAFYPHVTIAWAPDTQTADQMAEKLDDFIRSTKPAPTAIGFGSPTVLVGYTGS